MGLPMRLHGDATTDAPAPEEMICPKCKKKRGWVITRLEDGEYIKKCNVCGTEIKGKRPHTGEKSSKAITSTSQDNKKIITCPNCFREFSSTMQSGRTKSVKCPYCLFVIKK